MPIAVMMTMMMMIEKYNNSDADDDAVVADNDDNGDGDDDVPLFQYGTCSFCVMSAFKMFFFFEGFVRK